MCQSVYLIMCQIFNTINRALKQNWYFINLKIANIIKIVYKVNTPNYVSYLVFWSKTNKTQINLQVETHILQMINNF